MSYLELEGQKEVIQELNRLIQADRPASCFLLVGEAGAGEIRFCTEWAKAVNCLKGEFFKNCTCMSCQKIEKKSHPDVFWIGEDAEERTIKIGKVREIQEKASIRPYEGKKKVFVILGAERFTEEASNALLKTLEEPPANTLFILVSGQTEKLLPTILSRLVKISLKKLSTSEIEEILSNKVDWTQKEIEFLASESKGSLGKALQLHEEGFFEFKNKTLSAYLKNKRDFFSNLDPSDREVLRKIVKILSSFTRDGYVSKLDPKSKLLIHRDRAQDILQFLQPLSFEDLTRRLSLLEQAESALDQNLNGRLIALRLQETL